VKYLRTVFRISIIALIFYFVVSQILQNKHILNEHIKQFDWLKLLVSLILFFLGQLCFSSGWYRIICSNKRSIGFHQTIHCWALSGLGKYVPGRIWQFAGRLYLFEKLGLTKMEIASFSVIEQFFFLHSALLLGSLIVVFLPSNAQTIQYSELSLCCLLLILIGFAGIHPGILNWGMKLVSKLSPKMHFRYEMRYRQAAFCFLHFLIGWVSTGIGFAVLTSTFLVVDARMFWFLTGANSAAYFLGYIVILTPGGLGVREGALTYMLNFVLLPGIGAMLSVLTRLWYILGEMLFLGVTFLGQSSAWRKLELVNKVRWHRGNR
jgi:glycosyltransferase 2 family protein